MPLEIKPGLYARAKHPVYRALGVGVVDKVEAHSDGEVSVCVKWPGGAYATWMWENDVELSEWIDPLDCVFP